MQDNQVDLSHCKHKVAEYLNQTPKIFREANKQRYQQVRHQDNHLDLQGKVVVAVFFVAHYLFGK